MSGRLIAGYDGSEQANYALALGRLLTAEPVAACVYPAGTYFAHKCIPASFLFGQAAWSMISR